MYTPQFSFHNHRAVWLDFIVAAVSHDLMCMKLTRRRTLDINRAPIFNERFHNINNENKGIILALILNPFLSVVLVVVV